MSEQETTFLAARTILKGELQLAGPATIAGRLEGAISGEHPVQVVADGSVEGDIQGTLIDIQGAVKGNIMASQLCRLGATARVSGELRAANLAIVEGACFVGQVCVGGPSMEQTTPPAAQAPQQVKPQVIQQPAPVRPQTLPQTVQTPQTVAQEMAAASNRIAAIASQAEEVATAAATAATGGAPTGTVNIIQDNIQNALRGPKIIRARS